ncbi:MAG: prepilin-type N-terminal cleavage/methylation domain-containing protein [Halothiobacillus sp.]
MIFRHLDHHPQRRQHGMTLIEVVIALVLFALIALALVSAMGTMGSTLTRSSQRIDDINDMRIITQFLRQTVGAPQLFFVPAANGSNADFHGDQHSLYFVGNLSGYQGPGGLHLIHLYTATTGAADKQQLVVQFLPWQPGQQWVPDFSTAKPHVLIDGLSDFSIHYLAPEGTDNWQPEWSRLDRYPLAIRLNIAVAGRYWPEIVNWIGGARNGL